MTLKEEIQRAEDKLVAAMAERDTAKIANLYTADARLMPHGVPTLSGRGEVAAFFEQAFTLGIVSGKFTTLEVDGSENEAVEIGAYELFAQPPSGPPVRAEKGRYCVVWKRIDSQWLLFRDMFNSDAAPV